MGKIRWYPRDPDAALAGMMDLSLEERGAYNTVLDLIYSRDGSIVDDDRFLAGWMRCDIRVWKRIRARLLATGKLYLDGDRLRNSRADQEVDRGLSRIASAREAGRASGRKRNGAVSEIKDLGERPVERTPELTTVTVIKEVEQQGKKKKDQGSATRLPEDWKLPATWGREAMSRGLTEPEVRLEADSFRNHWLSKAGADAKKLNWYLTWLNWVNRSLKILHRAPRLPSEANGGTPAIAAPEWDRKQWEGVLAIWRSSGRWMAAAGPEPGKPGCRVPADLLKPDGDHDAQTVR